MATNNSTQGTKLDFFEWLERITMEIIGQSMSHILIYYMILMISLVEFGVRFEAIEGARHPLMLCAFFVDCSLQAAKPQSDQIC